MNLPASLTRRRFLATTAAAATAAQFARAAAGEPRTLGFALVGIGRLTMGQLLPAFAECRLARPVALVSGHPDKAREQAQRYGVDPKNIYNYENFDAIADNPAIDVVYVVLPNSMHAEYTIRAAQAGKHVLCEKPMANSVADCQAMIDACRAASRKLMIAYRMRYEPMTQRAIELAQSPEAVGAIRHITAEAGFAIGDPNQWRLKKDMAGGGPLMDMGIYAVNAARYLSGQEPVEVVATSFATPGDPRFAEVEETLALEMRFPENFIASCLTTYNFNCNRFCVYGERGRLEAEPFQGYGGNRLFQVGRNGRQEVTYEPVNHFAAEMDDFCTCILADRESRTPGEDGLQDIKILTAAYESARTGQAVKLA
jgi:glucose-fructose oxidoreductase